MEILYILAKTAEIALSVISLAMFLRFLLSLFLEEENRFYIFLCFLTEPVIAPVRALLYHFHIGEDSPIDWAFSLTYLLIAIVEMFLPVL